MGCVSSNLLNQDDDFTQLGSSALGHHIVSLTSTTYGLLTLDPPHTPSRFTLGSLFPSEPKSLWSEPRPFRSEPEVINSWELMSGLDTDSFRFSPLQENSNPNRLTPPTGPRLLKKPGPDRFQKICPPNGENRVVLYTTTLRGVRRTFEACNVVRAAFEAFGVLVCERDVSMHSAFREELRVLLKGKQREATVPPRVFVNGLYIGGAEEMLKVAEEGLLGDLLQGLPRKKIGAVCDGCGDMRFLPCFNCNGSCKTVVKEEGRTVVVKCNHCNENGLVLCPLCS
ncbi:electron carrier [Spatholobus suberectus]|nr:electron carrier [Spatholobus suberectus]